MKANPAVRRDKAAIRRGEPSISIKCLQRDNFLRESWSFFDYGCGHVDDLRHVRALGLKCSGWDPAHRSQAEREPAELVNLGFVLNVIEDARERAEVLRSAWQLSRKVLSVAARIMVGGRGSAEVEFGDGVLTRIGTFQKYYSQSELREYIEETLEVDAVPAAPGVLYVFRDEELREQFLATKYRRQSSAPRKRLSEQRFEQHRELLEPLMQWIALQGRPPERDEYTDAAAVEDAFGSLRRAFALIRRVTGDEDWVAIHRKRSEDLLVYLALSHFRRRPKYSRLPKSIQRDVRAFFGTYTRACQQADALLFKAGDADAIDDACKQSSIGKLLPNALYVHHSALDELDPLLRVYEGCGRAYLGEIEGANIIKLHRFPGKLSYLVYPDFDSDPHPALLRCVKLSMRERELYCYDYSQSENPPILHRKETFVADDHPLREKFARLTRQEERHGVLDETSRIGTRRGWGEHLAQRGFRLSGHRLIRVKE